MVAARRRWAAELLHLWFHELKPGNWFGSNPEIDDLLRRRFSHELAHLAHRPAHEFLSDPETARAAVLLFDQVPRNLYRNDARAFRFDSLARAIAKGALQRRWDRGLSGPEKQFLAMPLMHSEQIADQLRSLRYYAKLGPRFGWPFARSHYAMIARFGRYPHRNAVLGRKSTPAEIAAVEAGNHW
jgi:uncharacterized protein (DUF924 family)